MWMKKTYFVSICFTIINILIIWEFFKQISFTPVIETNEICNAKPAKSIQLHKHGLKTAIGQCTEVTKIVFLKTHKTAGSSIQNMLMRFGIERNLSFLIPRVGNYFGHPEKFQLNMVKQKLKEHLTYDIFAHHARYNRSEISTLMPRNTNYFTILRDPVTLFESVYSFCRLERDYNMTIEAFVRPNVSEVIDSRNKRRGRKMKFGRNQMMFDLGFEVKDFEEDETIAEFIQRLESDFQLVLITERLSESLILMKDLLCWSLGDIVLFRHSFRKVESRKEITPELRNEIIRWNRADKYLYDHFKLILDKKIAEYGEEKMARDLNELESVTNEWYDYCVESTADNSELEGDNKVWSLQVLGFKLKNKLNKTCVQLTKAEYPFTEEIQRHMRKYYEQNLRNTTILKNHKQNIFQQSASFHKQ